MKRIIAKISRLRYGSFIAICTMGTALVLFPSGNTAYQTPFLLKASIGCPNQGCDPTNGGCTNFKMYQCQFTQEGAQQDCANTCSPCSS